jgi:hypothetical protein
VFLSHNELRSNVVASPEALDRLAKECRSAFDEMRDFCPEAFEHESECLFLFEEKKEAIKAADKVSVLGLRADAIGPAEITLREPILSPPEAAVLEGSESLEGILF